jgi:ribosomal protein S18 acetylase RimI-like enzyme
MERFAVRRLRPDEWQAYRAIRLQALSEAPDAFGATLEEALARPPESWAARLAEAAASGIDCPLAAEANGALVGLGWAKVDALDPGLVNLYQMWVAPQWRGRGVAGALLQAAIDWATAREAHAMGLGVNCANTGAIRLYERAGFVTLGDAYPMREGTALMEQHMRLELAR